MKRTAIELAAAATRLEDPLEGLRAVAELRRRLEDLEALHVEQAIRSRLSWSQTAAALGISKQAAHKKHASRLKGAGRTAFATEARERGVLVTGAARRAVQHAAQEARDLGHAKVGTGHLLLGLLAERHEASAALRRIGLTAASLRAAIKRPERRGSPQDGPPSISPQGRAALERSLREAVVRGDRHLGVEHVLLALLDDETSDAARTLAHFRVRREDVEGALDRGRNVRSHA